MRIPLKHSETFMPRHARHLHDAKPLLEQPGRGLVPQVMEAQIGQEAGIGFGTGGGAVFSISLQRPRLAAHPRFLEAIGSGPAKHTAVDPAGQGLHGAQGIKRGAGQRNSAALAILGVDQVRGFARQIDPPPFQPQQLAQAHRGLDSHDDDLSQAWRALCCVRGLKQSIELTRPKPPVSRLRGGRLADGFRGIAGRQWDRQFFLGIREQARQSIEVVNHRLRRQAILQQLIAPGGHIKRPDRAQEERAELRIAGAHVAGGPLAAQTGQHGGGVPLNNFFDRDPAGFIGRGGKVAALQVTLDFARPVLGVGLVVKSPTDGRCTLAPNLGQPTRLALLEVSHPSPPIPTGFPQMTGSILAEQAFMRVTRRFIFAL